MLKKLPIDLDPADYDLLMKSDQTDESDVIAKSDDDCSSTESAKKRLRKMEKKEKRKARKKEKKEKKKSHHRNEAMNANPCLPAIHDDDVAFMTSVALTPDEADIIAESDCSSTKSATKRLKKKEKKKKKKARKNEKKERKKSHHHRYEAMNANLPVTTLDPDVEYITCDVCFKDTHDIIHGVFFRCLDCHEDMCCSCYREGRHSTLHRIYFMGHVPGEEGVDRNGKRRAEDAPVSATPPIRRSMLIDNNDD